MPGASLKEKAVASEPSRVNPYASPKAIAPSDGGRPVKQPAVTDFGVVICTWETLRLVYNAVLVALVLALVGVFRPQNATNPAFWIEVAIGAALANLLFFLGPAVEGYGRHFRLWNRGLTIGLFVLGLTIAALMASACVLAHDMP